MGWYSDVNHVSVESSAGSRVYAERGLGFEFSPEFKLLFITRLCHDGPVTDWRGTTMSRGTLLRCMTYADMRVVSRYPVSGVHSTVKRLNGVDKLTQETSLRTTHVSCRHCYLPPNGTVQRLYKILLVWIPAAISVVRPVLTQNCVTFWTVFIASTNDLMIAFTQRNGLASAFAYPDTTALYNWLWLGNNCVNIEQ